MNSTLKIPLSRGLFALVDSIDFERLSTYRWYASKSKGAPYARRSEGYSKVLMHRQILQAPTGVAVDHINGDTLDNRRINLRLASHAQNCQNKKKHRNNTSGYKGVYYNKTNKGWVAEIISDGKYHYLGTFNSPEEAATAYDKASSEYHREYSRPNAPVEPREESEFDA